MANSNGWGDGAANNAIGWGQGANNNIGWGSSHATSWAGATDIVGLTTDADAQAFITAAAITDATQQSAIDTLVKGMKADGVWTKMKAIYPFVGGTATTHKWNLKDPRDLDAAFRLVFNGGWTHSSNGATPNGTNGYADTKLVPSSVLSTSNYSLGFYSRTDVNGSYTQMGSNSLFQIYARLGNAIYYDVMYPSRITVTNASSLGLFNFSRTTLNRVDGYKNGVNIGNDTTTVSSLTNDVLKVGAGNIYSPNQLAYAYVSNGLTDTEAANLYTRVQAFQTSLSRQV